MSLPDFVKIVDVGPRDGLQNEAVTVPAEVKVKLIEDLADAGLRVVEAGAFVSPRWIPQMADTDAVFGAVKRKPGVSYPTLAFNMKGLERAAAVGVEDIALGVAASETFSRKNTNCSIAESLDRSRQICDAARERGMRVRGYVSCVLGCPYEGETDITLVADLSRALADMGCAEISLGDTIGVGTPARARNMVEAVADRIPASRLAVHFHDTYGQALANILACLEVGIAVVDSSVSGLGGCPYAPGAAGNVATEDVLYMVHGLGIETGVDLDHVVAAGSEISRFLGRAPVSKVALAMSAIASV